MNSVKHILFIDYHPTHTGGMEMHAEAYINHFTANTPYPLDVIIAFSPNILKPKKQDNIIILPKQYIHKPQELINILQKMPLSTAPIFFFNNIYWIECQYALRNKYTNGYFVQRSGGNDILQSHILSKGQTLTQRRDFVVNTINNTVNVLLVNSKYSYENFIRIGIDPKCMHIIIGGVKKDRFAPISPKLKIKLRKKLALPQEAILILSVCRLVQFKGLEYLLHGLSKVYKMHKNIHHIIIGDGPERQNIKKIINKLSIEKNTHLIGEVPMYRIHQYYQAADIYALTPVLHKVNIGSESYIHTETMGRSFCEAISTNLPIIASTVGGIPEVVKDYCASILVPEKKIVSISEAIIQVYKKLPIPIQNSKLTQQYSWDTLFKKYEQLFTRRKKNSNISR